MTNQRTYLGHEIVKQSVGLRGWNVVQSDTGQCVKTGLPSINEAKEWIEFYGKTPEVAARWN